MKTYSTSDLVRAIGDVTHAAVTEPVVITHHAKPRYVLMSIEEYGRLAKMSVDPRQVYRTEETPPELARVLVAAIDEAIAEIDSSDGS
jgi:prevent-host-death family protein